MSAPAVVYQGWLVNCDRCSFNRYRDTEEEAHALADEHADLCPGAGRQDSPIHPGRAWS